ncbi:MAG TPA: pseudouridine synthase [Caulobacteraceae bacterium]
MVDHPSEGARKGRSGQAKKGPGAKGGSKGGKPEAPKVSKKADRIAKVLARAGVASRREVERLIGLGKVAVNGRILDTPATLISRDDVVTVDGKPIAAAEPTRVWRYHKPVGLLTSHADPEGRPTVFAALPPTMPRVISVGRLDINSEGLLLLTNDGALSRALELPATALTRRYRVRARGRANQAKLDTLKDGIEVDGVRYGPIEASLDKASGQGDSANLWITVTLSEGKNREVRKVLEAVGLTVNRLIRLAYGPFSLGALPLGEVEEVGPRVIRELLAQYIAPENLPTGDRVEGGPAGTGRRPGASALADPSKKPSRVRAAAEVRATEDMARPPRTFDRPRDGEDRPKRAYGERPASTGGRKPYPSRDGGADRPRGDGPRKPYSRSDRPESGGAERPKRAFAPRTDGPRTDGPRKPYAPRDGGAGERTFKPRPAPGGDKPYRAPRPRAEGGAERPRDPKPAGERYYGPGDGTSGPKAAPRGRPAGTTGGKPAYGKPSPGRPSGAAGRAFGKPPARGADRPSGAKFGPRPKGPRPGGGGGKPGGPRKPRG